MDADKLIDEFLTILGAGLGTGWSATITWMFDTASADLLDGEINTVFQVNGGIVTGVYAVTPDGTTLTIGPVTSFSDWYAGDSTSDVLDWRILID